MKQLILAALLAVVPAFGTYGHGNGGQVAAHEQIVVDAYMDVADAHCYDSADNLVELANRYAAGRQVVVRVNALSHDNAIVRFQRQVRVRAVRNVRFVVVKNRAAAARNQVRVVVRAGRRGLLNRVFFGGFNRAARFRAQDQLDVRVRF